MVHLMYCDDKSKELLKILDGRMWCEKNTTCKVFKDELLYFMEKSTKKITAKAKVTDVKNYVKLSDEEITKIIEDNDNKFKLTDISYNYENVRFRK